jgi:hypothetical protein
VPPRQAKFEGKCDALKGHIYDCSDSRQADLYSKTTKEIAEYVGRTYTYGGDMRRAVERLEVPAFVMPEDPAEDATETEREIWKVEVKEFVHRRRSIRENLKTLYSLAWGQCTDIMRQKIEALDNHEQMATESDGLGLLRAIKNASFNFQSQKYVAHALHDAKRCFYLCSQSKHMTTQAYLEAFRGTLDVIEHTGGEIGHEPGIERYVAEQTAIDYDNMDDDEEEDVKREGKERYLAVAFLLGSDRSRFGRLLENLENNFLQGQNNYPATVTAAYSLLTNWKQDPCNLMRAIGPVNDGVSFTNVDDGGDDGDVTLANDGQAKGGGSNNTNKKKDKSHIICKRCGEAGHYDDKCDGERKTSGTNLLMDGVEQGEFDTDDHFQFLQHDTGTTLQVGSDGRVPKTWVLLDNQLTVDVFSNGALLKNIRENKTSMDIYCNAGVTRTNMVGDLPGYGTVWYHPKGIANILSLARVKEHGYHVTYDSRDGNQFTVHKPDGTNRVFRQSDRGLFYMDGAGDADGVTLVSTVEGNKYSYTNRDYSRAVLARKIQTTIGRPSTRTFINIVEQILLPNCPITKRDILAAEHIFGPDVGLLHGKTVRRKATRVEGFTVDVPAPIMTQYRNVILAGDIMFVNKIPFFVTTFAQE